MNNNYDELQLKMQRNCFDCQYYAASVHSCDYIIMEHHSRPCKPGDKCTVKKPRNNNRQRPTISKPVKPLPKDEWLEYMGAKKR